MSGPTSELQAQLLRLCDEAASEAAQVSRESDLSPARARFLGRKGAFSAVMRLLGGLPAADRPAAGALINEAKLTVEQAFDVAKARLASLSLADALRAGRVDVTLPGRPIPAGAIHPVERMLDDLVEILGDLGFDVAEGPEVETEAYNFDRLNMPAHHPARDMQDTFFVEGGLVLRTQTSPVQIRVMEASEPPYRIIAPGRVFRCDLDATHSPMFHQVEGLWVDRDVTLVDLKAVLTAFLKRLFGEDRELRFRPSYFPFTEPSVEVDVRRDDGAWMEVLGAGMVHPQVLRNVGRDPEEWQGFAFGIGVDRLAMIRHGITDIRLLFENDLRFLTQF